MVYNDIQFMGVESRTWGQAVVGSSRSAIGNIDIDRNIGTGDENDINDRTPSQGADRERSLLAGPSGGEERRSSGFRAVNTRLDSQGAVPMDVDEKPARGES